MTTRPATTKRPKDTVCQAEKTTVLGLVVASDTESADSPCLCVLEEKTFSRTVYVDKDKFVNAGEIVRFYGRNICQSLPAHHSLAGCDMTSHLLMWGRLSQ